MPKVDPADRLSSTNPGKKAARVVKVPICIEDEVGAEYEEAKSEYEHTKGLVQISPDSEALARMFEKANERLNAARTALKEPGVCEIYTFRAIGRKKFRKLQDDHPPTDEQIEEVKKRGLDPNQLGWNVDTFPPVIVAESVVEPALSMQDVMNMWDGDDGTWNEAEFAALYNGALEANTQRRVVDLGKG